MLKLKLLAGAIVLATGAPAAAQVSSSYNDYQYPQTRIEQLRQRLESGIQSRRISQSEAYTLRQEVRTLQLLERRYAANGLSRSERDQLNQRIWSLQQRMQHALRGSYYGNRGYGDYPGRGNDGYRGGYDNRYDRDGDEDYREEQWDERSGDWNDRDWEAERPDEDDDWDDRRDSGERNRWNNGNQGYQGGYSGGGGQGTYAVPERFRYQYRDTTRHYYRYRDGYVYQIDRNTHRTVNTIWVGR